MEQKVLLGPFRPDVHSYHSENAIFPTVLRHAEISERKGKMPDFDAIIIGGGPAGLTAGIYLSRGKCRTLLIDKDGFGGNIKNADWIENYPGFSDGVAGTQLASEMTIQAVNSGLQMEMAEVAGIESYSESTCVQLTDGRYFTAKVL